MSHEGSHEGQSNEAERQAFIAEIQSIQARLGKSDGTLASINPSELQLPERDHWVAYRALLLETKEVFDQVDESTDVAVLEEKLNELNSRAKQIVKDIKVLLSDEEVKNSSSRAAFYSWLGNRFTPLYGTYGLVLGEIETGDSTSVLDELLNSKADVDNEIKKING